MASFPLACVHVHSSLYLTIHDTRLLLFCRIVPLQDLRLGLIVKLPHPPQNHFCLNTQSSPPSNNSTAQPHQHHQHHPVLEWTLPHRRRLRSSPLLHRRRRRRRHRSSSPLPLLSRRHRQGENNAIARFNTPACSVLGNRRGNCLLLPVTICRHMNHPLMKMMTPRSILPLRLLLHHLPSNRLRRHFLMGEASRGRPLLTLMTPLSTMPQMQ
jgi:hypothetical protein